MGRGRPGEPHSTPYHLDNPGSCVNAVKRINSYPPRPVYGIFGCELAGEANVHS